MLFLKVPAREASSAFRVVNTLASSVPIAFNFLFFLSKYIINNILYAFIGNEKTLLHIFDYAIFGGNPQKKLEDIPQFLYLDWISESKIEAVAFQIT